VKERARIVEANADSSGFGVGTTTPMRQAHTRVLAIKFCKASDALSRTREMPRRNTSSECDGRYCPLAAGLSPSLIASASLTYLPFLVVP
jgi:hypothetical protein